MRRRSNPRERLARAAMQVTYRRGFANTSLADISKAAGIPVGNVFYHFKTKDEIGGAIIDLRLGRLNARLRELEKLRSPKARLCGFVQIKIDERDQLARRGCPAGTLVAELHKQRSGIAMHSTELFERALAWLAAQFHATGKGKESRALAVHLLSATQGVSLLAHSFRDPSLITEEAARLKTWIRSL